MKDYLYCDPATRYQIAKNAFERSLHDANNTRDVTFILDDSANQLLKEEVNGLLLKIKDDKNIDQMEKSTIESRLFELFLQKTDMRRFSKGFKEIISLLGNANESDPFDWSQFKIETSDDVRKLQTETKRLESLKVSELEKKILGPDSKVVKKSEKNKNDKNLIIKAESSEEKDVNISLEDPTLLKDKDGNVWSGVILNTDMVQKTMPGNRVNSHRALVVVGNLRGAAGYGMGKGKTSGDALNAG